MIENADASLDQRIISHHHVAHLPNRHQRERRHAIHAHKLLVA